MSLLKVIIFIEDFQKGEGFFLCSAILWNYHQRINPRCQALRDFFWLDNQWGGRKKGASHILKFLQELRYSFNIFAVSINLKAGTLLHSYGAGNTIKLRFPVTSLRLMGKLPILQQSLKQWAVRSRTQVSCRTLRNANPYLGCFHQTCFGEGGWTLLD